MALFESILTLALVAIALLQVSRGLAIPYPTMLALSGVVVAALPWAPDIVIDPRLALALFIAPALLDAAYDMPPRTLRRYWLPLLALAAVAVVLTTAAVAWTAVALAGMPLAAAVALGAIVAPPDAAAAAAMLRRFELPRSTVTVLTGESLLNDAVALLIFGTAVAEATAPESFAGFLPELASAVPGGVLAGYLLGRLYIAVSPKLAGTLGGTLFQFVSTFGVWVIADHLHLSAILATVAYAMTVARIMPERQSPRERVHSLSVWEATVFLLNVLAFLLMGLQARAIFARLDPGAIWQALGFAGAVLGVVVAVRVAWVLAYNRALAGFFRMRGRPGAPTFAQALVVSWCGMRGLVTLATALALPAGFPARDLIVLTALVVVLGTLVVQGMTLAPLIRLLRFQPDESFGRQLTLARLALLDAAIASLGERRDEAATRLRETYLMEREVAADGHHPRAVTDIDRLRRHSLKAKRRILADLRRSGRIDEDVFHTIEQELDWAELAASPPDRFELIEG